MFNMKPKRIFLTTIVMIGVVLLAIGFFVGNINNVSAEDTIEKISDKDYIDSLRNNDSVEVIGNVLKTYDAETKLMTFADDKGLLVQFVILTPYENRVSPNDMTKPVARWSVPEHRDGAKFFDNVDAYDKDNGYVINPKNFVWKYLVETEVTDCYNTIENETVEVCYNYFKKEWIIFNDWKQLPDGANEIGLFTNAILGENIEFVFNIFSFEVLEYASYLVTDLISYWKLDESSGSVLDAHASNNGTNYGATPNVAGKIGTSYDFEKDEDDYISLGDIADGNAAISISLWVNPETLIAGERQIFSKDSNVGGRSWVFGQTQSGKIRWSLWDNNNVEYIATTDDVHLSVGNWTHVLVTANIATDTKHIYIDGVDVDFTNSGSAWSGTTIKDSTGDLLVGRRVYSGYNEPWDGKIDEIGIWNVALNSTAITELYNSNDGLAYPFEVPTCTFSGYVFDEDSNALNGANVTIWNQYDITEYYETTTNSSGIWTADIVNGTNTYMAGAYYNNTLIGQLKPYILGTC